MNAGNKYDNKRLAGRSYVIAGGSGFLGTSLATQLSDLGANVVVLSRHPPEVSGNWRALRWDGRTVDLWADELEGIDGIVNLAGRSVDCIKTAANKDEILRSRVESTRAIGLAMTNLKSPPHVWVQMSTAHIYGDPAETICDEDSPAGIGLAPDVGQAWEDEFSRSILPGQKAVILRTSFVIGRNRGAGQGALGKLGFLTRIGLGGTIGTGKQGMSWIHESDMNRLIVQALTDDNMTGVFVASSPNPVSQQVFMQELRRAMGIRIGLPAFEWMVRLGAPVFLNTDPELALYGRYVVSKRLKKANFKFQYPDLNEALREIYSTKVS